MSDATDTATEPKCFHLNLDSVPDVVKQHVESLLKKIASSIRAAEVITWVDGVMADLGVPSTGTIPTSVCDGAWCTILLKDGSQLSALRRALVAGGWHLSDRQDYPEDHRFVLNHARGDQRISLNCYIGGEGSRCRWEKVGEKTVPVMELRCDGAEVAP